MRTWRIGAEDPLEEAGEEWAQVIFEQGRTMTLDEVVAYAAGDAPAGERVNPTP